MSAQVLNVPIRLEAGVRKKKTFYLNLNQYKQWHFQESNQLKKLFKIAVAKDIRQLTPLKGSCKIEYKIFYPTNRKFDLDNIGSIVCKFTQDALVELGFLVEDNITIIKEVTFKFGGVDKENPRCEVTIIEENVMNNYDKQLLLDTVNSLKNSNEKLKQALDETESFKFLVEENTLLRDEIDMLQTQIQNLKELNNE